MELDFLVANLATAKARRAILNGREYLVAPAVSIVPGVLNGSQGRLYYPPEECSSTIQDWDGMPITAYHPIRNGIHVAAARAPHQHIGFVRDSVFNGKSRHQLYFDVERTRQVDNANRQAMGPGYPAILPRLEAGKPIELSTGLFTSNEPAGRNAVDPATGRGYDYIARNHIPDHLAVLPDQMGACSVSDGCGVHVTNADFTSDAQRKAFFGKLLEDPEVSKHIPKDEKGNQNPNALTHPHMAHLLHGSKILSEGHSRAEAKSKAIDLRSKGVFAGVFKDTKTGKHIVTVPANHVTNTEELIVNRRTIWQKLGEAFGITANAAPDQTRHPPTGRYHSTSRTAAQRGYKSHEAHDDLDEDEDGNDSEVEEVTNANPEGHNQYTGGAGALAASKSAFAASKSAGPTRGGGAGSAKQSASWARTMADQANSAKSPATGGMLDKKDISRLHGGAAAHHDDAASAHEKAASRTAGAEKDAHEKAASAHRDAASEHRSAHDKLTTNAFPAVQETPMPFGQMALAKPQPHDMSKQAAGASMDDPKAREPAMAALDASKGGDSAGAAQAHTMAAKVHEKAATQSRMGNDPDAAEVHDDAAAMHRKAASMHAATRNTSDRAAGAATRNKVVPAGECPDCGVKMMGGKCPKCDATNNAAQPPTRRTTMTMTREAALKKLTANCKCDEDRYALNQLSNDALIGMATINAKADSSNLDTSGGGSIRVGGKQEGIDDDDEEYPEGAAAGARMPGKKGTTTNRQTLKEWEDSMPPEARSVWNSAKEVEQRERQRLVRRITANVDLKTEDGKQTYNELMMEPLPKLRRMLRILPVDNERQQQEPQQDPSTNYLGANDAPGVLNFHADDPDVLDTPAMNWSQEKQQTA